MKENRVDIYYGKEDSELTALFQFLDKSQSLLGTYEGGERVKQLKACMNMKVLAQLENGEEIMINRSYKKHFAKQLEKLRREGESYEDHK